MAFGVAILAFTLAIILIVVVSAAAMRVQREKHRVELQKAILERMGSVKDFAEFLTTAQGERFLGSLAPAHSHPLDRLLWSVRIGIVMLTIGVFLMAALHSPVFGSFGNTRPPTLLLGMLLLIAAGIGMLLSAAASFIIGRGLGMFDRPHGGPGKGDAG